MSIAKQQHFVPQSYLRRFTTDGKSLHVFDKHEDKVYLTNIKNIAVEKSFYNLPEEPALKLGIDPHIVENTLGDMENEFKQAVNEAIRQVEINKEIVLEPDTKRILAHFMVLQNLRTRESRKLLIQMVELSGNKLANEFPDLRQSKIQIKANEDWVDLLQLQIMFNPKSMAVFINTLLGHIWWVGLNNTSTTFYTSDHPFVRRANYIDPYRSYSGLASPGIELALPLSSRYILILGEKKAFRDYQYWNGKAVTLQDDNVTYYNSLQVLQSYRQLYCEQKDFSLAKEICNDRPEVRSPDRTRIVVK